MAHERFAVGNLEKLVQAIELGRVGVPQIRTSILDAEFAVAPSVRDIRAEVGLFPEAPYLAHWLPWRQRDGHQARIVHADHLRIEAECVDRAFGLGWKA